MAPRAAVLALAAVALLAPALAKAQDDPVVVNVAGPCVLSINGVPGQCEGVSYMAFPENHRVDFAAITDQAGWAFSGDRDGNEDGHYRLELDSVVSPQAGRLRAEGQCAMDIADDGVTVRSIECLAHTNAGVVMQLKASGTAQGDDDDDDDDDAAPGGGQG
jgi:hypothetical protein